MSHSGAGWSLAIDFGTTNTAAAVTVAGAAAQVLEIEGSRYFPSVVYRDEAGQLLTGRAAVRQAAVFPERAERIPKRALVSGSEVVLAGHSVAPTDLVAAVLSRVYAEATRYQGGPAPTTVVLTHPARWGESLLGRLRDAATKAGIGDPVFVAEPVAAAWWYARPSAGAVVGVFDLGGGTLDTALLRANDEGYRVAGPPGGDANLGGEDFDELLLDQVMRVARDRDQELWSEVFTAAGPRARRDMALLRADVTMAKETLSEHLTFDLSVAGYAEEFRLTRAEFEELIGAAVDGATEEMIRTITGADASPGDLTGLFLTGGSSRIPLIAGRLADKLGLQPQLRDDPKAVVALGALTAVAEGRPAAKNTGTKTSPAPPHTATTPSRLTRTIAINTASVNYTLGRVAFSPDGSLLAAAVSGVAWLWRPSTGECVGEMRSAMTSGAVAFSPDGDRLAAGACLWSVPAGSLQHVLEAGPVERLPVKRKFGGRVVGGGLVPWVSDVSFSPDGRLLVTAGAPNPQVPGVLRIWDPASGELVRTFGSGYDEAVAFSPDGQLLAVISGEYYSGRVTDRGKNVQLWDVQSGALIRTFTTEYTGQRAKSLAFSPAGNLVAVSETFARISLYDVADGKRVRELRNYYADIGQKEPFRSGALAFSPDGRLLATAEYQWPGGRVKLWEVESGRAVAVLRGQEAYIKGLAFSPDGRMLAMVVLSTHGTLPPQHHGVVQVFE